MECKPRLIILSDLWGTQANDWVVYYTELLHEFDIQYYDCCLLGDVETLAQNQESIHQQFVVSGIDSAVDELLALEREEVNILAFSIGGVIAWKAGLKGLNMKCLYAVSSTRLRYETTKPSGNLKLYYGEDDSSKPSKEWFENLSVDFEILKNKDHKMYSEKGVAVQLCMEINSV
jgi:hypothetical protein